jgi:hypothetical protein
VEDAVGPVALARVGWDARSRRRALARGDLVKGKLDLAARRYSEAYASYRKALVGGADVGVRARALRGMLSARMREMLTGWVRS